MMEILSHWDANLFLLVNHIPHSPFFDSLFAFLSVVGYWGIVWIVIGCFVFFRQNMAGRRAFLQFLLSILVAVAFAHVLKLIFGRLRPEFSLPETLVIMDETASYAFPSGHAAAAFAGATMLAVIDSKRGVWYYLLALLISFSRLYLGKHYPSDVIAGAILGWAVSAGILYWEKNIYGRPSHKKRK